MSAAMLAGIGLGASVLGGGMNAIGTHQGARALRREKQRQLAEMQASSRAREGAIQGDLDRFTSGGGPAMRMQAATGAELSAMENATGTAADAGASALGLTGADAGAVKARMRAPLRVKAGRVGADVVDQRRALERMALAGEIDQINSDAERARSLWEQREAVAAQKGQALRTIGAIVGGLGMPLMSMGMASAPGGAPTGGGLDASQLGGTPASGGAGPAQYGAPQGYDAFYDPRLSGARMT